MNGQVICETCGVLVDISNYEKHLKYGHNLENSVSQSESNKNHKCHMCSKTFTSAYNLKYHIAHHINARSFACTECPKAYNTASDLAQHKRIHSNIVKVPRKAKKLEPQTCPVCSKTVLRLTMHIQLVHKNQRNYNCEFCHKKFGKKAGLDRHILVVHKNIKNFKCDQCGKTFGEKSLLRRHQSVHSSVKTSFYCNVCKKYVGDIKNHCTTEHADVPFECEYCFRRYAKQREYRVHVSSKHTKLRKWLCDLCGNKFAEKYQLRRHFRSHFNANGGTEANFSQLNDLLKTEARSPSKKSSAKKSNIKNFGCKLCPKKFKARPLLRAHLERHQHKKENYCNICKIYDDNIKEHYEAEHNDLEFTCEICFKKFGRNTQLRNHKSSNHVDHFCDICGKIFCNLIAIKSHMDMVHFKPVTIEESDDNDYNDSISDQGNDFDDASDFFERETKADIEIVNVNSIDIKKEPVDLYDEIIHETELQIKDEPLSDLEELDTFDSEIADNIKEEITIEQEKIQEPEVVEDVDDQEFKCNVCKKLYPTKDTFRQHFMSKHVKNKNNSFICKACDKTYKSKELIFIHVRRIHRKLKNEPFKEQSSEQSKSMCSICGKILSNEKILKTHIKTIHNEKQIPCTVCGKKFSLISLMHRHRSRTHEGVRKHKCDNCPQKFATNYELELHTKHNHNLDRENTFSGFMCYCGVSFPRQCVLSRHKRSVHGDKDPDIIRECEICKEVFANLTLKRKHMAQVHLNGKNLKRSCGFCKQEFDLYKEFKAHIESHVGLFICITCGEFFIDAESLKSHQTTHRSVDFNLRKIICDYCGHRTFSKRSLLLHMIKHVKDSKTHYCDICGKEFKLASSLYTHRKYHAEGEFPCTHCDRKFATNAELVAHIRTHTNEKPFRCQICDRRFRLKILLKSHHETHPETRVMNKCKKCNHVFADKKQLNIHEESVHLELRPFRCYICCMSFRYKHNLIRHNKHKHL